MNDFYAQAAEELKQGRDLCLATIVSQTGSAPRELGTHCIVKSDGAIIGTIGGGRLEGEVIAAALAALKDRRFALISFSLKGKEVAGPDMVCGGDVEVYIEPVLATDPTAVYFLETVAEIRRRGGPALLATLIRIGPVCDVMERKLLLAQSAPAVGAAAEFGPLAEELYGLAFFTMTQGGRSGQKLSGRPGQNQPDCYLEPIVRQPVAYVFGGGHICLYLSKLLPMVGFRLVVFDDRPEFANRHRFPQADEVRVVDFQNALEGIPLGPEAYVIIVTRGHGYDKEVLAQALQRETAYVGMISSRRKRALVFEALEAEGIEKRKLDAVFSPIGLDIGAQTPEEIAVSVVAELIAVRAGKVARPKMDGRCPAAE